MVNIFLRSQGMLACRKGKELDPMRLANAVQNGVMVSSSLQSLVTMSLKLYCF
jgi:hypothetical protein